MKMKLKYKEHLPGASAAAGAAPPAAAAGAAPPAPTLQIKLPMSTLARAWNITLFS